MQTYEADIAQEDGTDRRETIDEIKNLKQLLTQKLKTPQGLRMNQAKYQIIRQFDDEASGCYTVYGKKAMGGVAIVNAGKVIVVATFDEKKQHTSPGCNESIAEFAKYLKSVM
ncbi:hypothetical protein EON64_07355 [archaeon]|nr:MAG: hypothetical protein EON64_07355 [archaeon]